MLVGADEFHKRCAGIAGGYRHDKSDSNALFGESFGEVVAGSAESSAFEGWKLPPEHEYVHPNHPFQKKEEERDYIRVCVSL